MTTTRFAPSPTGYIHVGNLRTALMNYMIAAKAGHARSQHQVAGHYSNGQGCARDVQQAAAWYEKAAKGNHVAAFSQLALLHANGLVAAPSWSRARKLMQRAVLLDDGEQTLAQLDRNIATVAISICCHSHGTSP